MSLHDIAETIGTTTESQDDDDGDRIADTSVQDDLSTRSMDEYDGGWSPDH